MCACLLVFAFAFFFCKRARSQSASACLCTFVPVCFMLECACVCACVCACACLYVLAVGAFARAFVICARERICMRVCISETPSSLFSHIWFGLLGRFRAADAHDAGQYQVLQMRMS